MVWTENDYEYYECSLRNLMWLYLSSVVTHNMTHLSLRNWVGTKIHILSMAVRENTKHGKLNFENSNEFFVRYYRYNITIGNKWSTSMYVPVNDQKTTKCTSKFVLKVLFEIWVPKIVNLNQIVILRNRIFCFFALRLYWIINKLQLGAIVLTMLLIQ